MPEKFFLTPSRKSIVKSATRRSNMKVAKECLQNPIILQYILRFLGIKARNELKRLWIEDHSVLLSSPKDIKQLYVTLTDELKSKTPTLYSFYFYLLQTPRASQTAVVSVCAALIIKHRFQKVNLIQKFVGLVLYTGHSSKKVHNSYTEL